MFNICTSGEPVHALRMPARASPRTRVRARMHNNGESQQQAVCRFRRQVLSLELRQSLSNHHDRYRRRVCAGEEPPLTPENLAWLQARGWRRPEDPADDPGTRLPGSDPSSSGEWLSCLASGRALAVESRVAPTVPGLATAPVLGLFLARGPCGRPHTVTSVLIPALRGTCTGTGEDGAPPASSDPPTLPLADTKGETYSRRHCCLY